MVEGKLTVSIPPIIPPQGNNGIPRGSLIEQEATKGRLVLFEPDASVRDAITLLLTGAGWTVHCVESCKGLMAAVEQGGLTALVSEATVPDCSAQQVLELGDMQDLPVIFTGHDLPLQAAVDLIRQGAVDFLDKPFPQSRLLDLLDRLAKGQNG